ncbi:hypothetical protein [Hyphomicrobium sp.]|uniref:hypothetical protein n=1 Tax=Hyphomicrobium sp. TaxID=82 RepID=UPI002D76D3E7|nr:hypothetical protein [Hyphomicrobium sp.]HET6390133.1 hypothetical protein [Hyphomicrobium sp.]
MSEYQDEIYSGRPRTKSVFQGIAGALILIFTLGVFGSVGWDAYNSAGKDKSGARRILAKRWNDRTLVFPIEGVDRAGRRAVFDVVVLTRNYGWVRGSTTELAKDDRRLSPQEIQDEVLAPQLREGLGSARGLIAVGLASQEGEVAREEQRGAERAARTAQWVRQALGERIPMWTLNLGRYVNPCSDCEDSDTSWQRPFIVIAVRQADPGTHLSEALAEAMSYTSNLPAPSRYSAFAFTKFAR